ncbi:hypothetical protein G6F22_019665 [Rhizopus arrhizus]|nr:hypothetical protein G6F22_019665 [Rhizopus arrhizus]
MATATPRAWISVPAVCSSVQTTRWAAAGAWAVHWATPIAASASMRIRPRRMSTATAPRSMAARPSRPGRARSTCWSAPATPGTTFPRHATLRSRASKTS